ncbi:MAG TPA: helix-turn-helix domain-containing protein [Candidatus Limnocylindrales bacterium]|nr:helix-turn-helix domain-containing protein [Candidatus Limnocylindrales bacterium]
MATRTSTKDPAWVSLTEACTLLGVSPSTIRRWGDTGMVRTFVTPGGHRRFSRAGVESLLPERPTIRPSLGDLGETPDRMARGYRRETTDDAGRIPWVAELDDAQRERFRAYGRSIVTALVAALDSDHPATRADRLREAGDACAEYGRIAGREGLGAPMTADLFLRFRRPFLGELGALARRREFDASATSALMADANAALDGLLLSTLRGWESAALADRRRPSRPSRPAPPTAS